MATLGDRYALGRRDKVNPLRRSENTFIFLLTFFLGGEKEQWSVLTE
jgi:hypothetical protein